MNSLILSLFIIFCHVYRSNCESCDLPKFQNCRKIEESKEFKSYTKLECCRSYSKNNSEKKLKLRRNETCNKRIEYEYCCSFDEANYISKSLCERAISNMQTTSTQRTTSRKTTSMKPGKSGKKTTHSKSTTIQHYGFKDNQRSLAYVDMDIVNDGKIYFPQDIDKVKDRKNENVTITPMNFDHDGSNQTTKIPENLSPLISPSSNKTSPIYEDTKIGNKKKPGMLQEIDRVSERENEAANATTIKIVNDGSNQNMLSANSSLLTKENLNGSLPKVKNETNLDYGTANHTENGQLASENNIKANQTLGIDQHDLHDSNPIYFENLNISRLKSDNTNFNKSTPSSDSLNKNLKNNETIEILQTTENYTKTPESTNTTTPSLITETKTPSTPKLTTTPQPTTTTLPPMTKSEIKCAEYGMSNIQKIKIMGLIGHKPREVTIDKCRHKAIPLVVGGREAMPYEFPHQALLGYEYREETIWKCGGSLVSRNFILTAAHCVMDFELGYVKTAKLGAFYQFENTEKVLIRNVVERWEHPDYDRLNRVDDIGLLKLDEFVPLSEYINPICLPIKQAKNKNAVGIGFGATESSIRSRRLMKVVLEQFEPYYPSRIPNETIVEKFIYFGHRTQRRDTCSGDSGSPLQISNDMNVKCSYTQIGIVSYGPNECGIPGVPAVYTNVFYYIDWITQYIWEDEDRLEQLNKTLSNTQ